jgi:hypothetical protein
VYSGVWWNQLLHKAKDIPGVMRHLRAYGQALP